MKVTIVGSGYVGLVTAACLADTGNNVLGVDINAEKVRQLSQGKSPIFEPGLDELLQTSLAAGRLRFGTDLAEGVAHGEVIFVAVGTPPKADGSADLSAVEAIFRGIAGHMTGQKVIAIKSTVPVGTNRHMSALVEELTVHPYAVVSNPEFLREGSALVDFLHPDRVVIGCRDGEAGQLMSELYAPYVRTPQAIMLMTPEAAEMVKYASNAYLAARISFINEMADICARTNVDIGEVRTGMAADRRIGPDFLAPGAGYGGSCFPKDVQALIQVAAEAGCDAGLLRAVHHRNEMQKQVLADLVLARFGADLAGRTFAVWGLAFKPGTDDIREAPAIRVIQSLSRHGPRLTCYDPKAGPNTARELAGLGNVHIVTDPYQAVQGADALIICTEWNEFRTPDFARIRAGLKQQVIFDGRNLYEPATMLRHRIEYYSIGRPPVVPQKRL